MWPRTDKERRRQRKCGFVAFMNRADGQAAKDEMQGVVVYDYELKIGWGKSVSPPSQALPAPPPGHMAIRSKEGGTVILSDLDAQQVTSGTNQTSELVLTPNVPTIMVVSPGDYHLCYVIDTMALHVLDGDCAFEQAIMERGCGNPLLNFLFELGSKGHTYYVGGFTPLLSGVQGDTPQRWRTEPFIMITGSGRWISPALPVFRRPGHEKESSATFVAGRSRVLLPLDHSDGFKRVEIMVCGGGASGAHLAAKKRHQFMTGLSSCGRMVLTDERPAWHVEQMPAPHVMSDMILLPTGDVLIINGASHGVAGWNNAHNPSLSPYLYKPNATIGHRFSALRPTHIPRMYHSSAILLPDGRILVAGSNTHSLYTFTGVAYPTELRVEAFMPYYMSKIFNCNRPANVSITYKNGKHGVRYGEEFVVRFKVRRTSARMEFHMYAPPFVTHSLSMNQRLLKLRCGNEGGGT